MYNYEHITRSDGYTLAMWGRDETCSKSNAMSWGSLSEFSIIINILEYNNVDKSQLWSGEELGRLAEVVLFIWAANQIFASHCGYLEPTSYPAHLEFGHSRNSRILRYTDIIQPTQNLSKT
jgi:hypothetical protein